MLHYWSERVGSHLSACSSAAAAEGRFCSPPHQKPHLTLTAELQVGQTTGPHPPTLSTQETTARRRLSGWLVCIDWFFSRRHHVCTIDLMWLSARSEYVNTMSDTVKCLSAAEEFSYRAEKAAELGGEESFNMRQMVSRILRQSDK